MNFVDTCRDTDFQCENKECIDSRDRCNGIEDCVDFSDEKNCSECGDQTFQ